MRILLLKNIADGNMKLCCCVFILLSFAATACGVVMHFTDCGSTATVHFVLIEQCTHDPCILQFGANYTILFNFTPHLTHNTVHSSMTLTYPLHPDEAVPIWTNYMCGDLSVLCPVRKGILQTYSATFNGPHSSEKNVAIKWEIKDEQDRHVVCLLLAELVQN